MEAALVLLRLVAFTTGAALFGAPLFALYAGVEPARLRILVVGCGAATAIGAAAALVVQTGQMAGDPGAGLDPSVLGDVIASGLGVSVIVRSATGLAACVAGLALRPGRGLWGIGAALGALALGALAWSGHGAADDGVAGLIHAAADVGHLLAAGVWLGALAAFALLLGGRPAERDGLVALHAALEGFSGVGSAVVAAIVATGLVNSWFLVGPDHLGDLGRTLWGQLLLLKLVAFAGMLGMAALNRYRLTPSLGAALDAQPQAALAALGRSIGIETALGLAVLALVAVLGTQPPPAAG